LQQLLRVIEPRFEFGTECLCGDLGGDADIAGQRISGDEFHFIDLDRASRTANAQGVFDLLGNVLRFGTGNSECANQPHKVFFGDVFGEVQAGESGGAQQSRETFFGLP